MTTNKKQLYLIGIVAGIITTGALVFAPQTVFAPHQPTCTPDIDDDGDGLVCSADPNDHDPCDPDPFSPTCPQPFFPPPGPIVTSSSAGTEDFTTTVIVEKEVFPVFDRGELIADREIEIIKKIIVTDQNNGQPSETFEVFAVLCDKFNVDRPGLSSVRIDCEKRDLIP